MRPPRPTKPATLSAPGLCWRPRRDHWEARWVARADLVKRGYAPTSQRLWAGTAPSSEDWDAIGSAATRLQDEMLAWLKIPSTGFDPVKMYDTRLKSLIEIYERDPDSPFRNLRYEVRQTYSSLGRTLTKAVGNAIVPALTFRDFKRWHESFSAPKQVGGPLRTARGHALMTHLRIVLSFGDLLRLQGCAGARDVLSKMEFPNPRRRVEVVTSGQAVLIRQEAHRQGYPSIAWAQSLMSDLMLRQKDVIGDLVPMEEPGVSEYVYLGRKWLYGLHWKEVSSELVVRHRLSKSLKGKNAILDPNAGKLETFDLKLYPMVMEELQHVTHREGPLVIREDTGRPWDSKSFNRAWRKIARAAGIPDSVQNRDSRAGAITEAFDADASPDKVRRSAGHSQLSTTMIYSRGNERARAEVIELRSKNRPQTA